MGLRFVILIIVSIVILAIISLLLQNRKDKKLATNSKYTIGNISEIVSVHKNQVKVVYQFQFQNQIFSGFVLAKIGEVKIDRFYAIRFLPENPKINQIIIKNEFYKLPEKLPIDGWDQMPR